MKTFMEFLKSSLVGGLFVLLPVCLLYLLLGELFELSVAIAEPITLLFPNGQFDDAKSPEIFAIILIVAASLVLGVLMRSQFGARAGIWIEARVLRPVPGYSFLKNLINSLGNTQRVSGIRAALKRLPDGGYRAIYVVEEAGEGFFTVLVPHAPAAMSGPIEILPANQVQFLDENFGTFMQSINHWGMGIGASANLDNVKEQ